MKRSIFKHVIAVTVLVIMLAVTVVPSAMAAAYHWGCEYSIPTGQTHWNGWDKGQKWTIDVGTECRYNVSILTSYEVGVHGSIFVYRRFNPDQWIAEVRFRGSNGTWQGRLFIPEAGKTYYSRITEETGIGVYGRTSVTIM